MPELIAVNNNIEKLIELSTVHTVQIYFISPIFLANMSAKYWGNILTLIFLNKFFVIF